MENTGRLTAAVVESARRIVLDTSWEQRLEDLRAMARVDRVHLLMLAGCGLVPADAARRLLIAILALEAQDFQPLCRRPAPRGVYLLYEDYLIETEGEEIGGILQTARSRNDLNATTARLQSRTLYLRVAREALGLQWVMLRRARVYSRIVMPGYTHYQAAVPITYGHYLAGVAAALDRDIGAIMHAADGFEMCPLGAGALGGTELPIDTRRTSRLLGFERGPLNSIDAVASRDVELRLLAATAIYLVSLARMATDFLQWQTAEFGFLSLPDELVGSSSAMPQKRNPFLLEHVRGRAGVVSGTLAGALASMHAAPFSNSIEASREALTGLPASLASAADMSHLMRLVVAGARPNGDTMRQRAGHGGTVATAYANRIARSTGLPFRTAHRMAGEMARAAADAGRPFGAVVAPGTADDEPAPARALDPVLVCEALAYGGGPAPSSLRRCLSELRQGWRAKRRRQRQQQRRWLTADQEIASRVQTFLAGPQARRTAVYFLCLDSAEDPVARHVWTEIVRLSEPVEVDLHDAVSVRTFVDADGNRYVFIGTPTLVAENWPRYQALLKRAYPSADLVGLVNWHESQHGPDRILCVHTNGDLGDGHFGRVDPLLNDALVRALEAHRRSAGLQDWTTLIEATHWAGTRCAVPAALVADDDWHLADIEIGSSEPSWQDPAAARAVASALVEVFSVPVTRRPTALVVGGRHFEPVFTSMMLHDDGVAVSHVLPNHALAACDNSGVVVIDHIRSCMLSVVGGVQLVVYHDSVKAPLKAELRALVDALGIELTSHRHMRRRMEGNDRLVASGGRHE